MVPTEPKEESEIRMRTILLTTAGLLLLLMGTIGLFVPVWPTTPFVIAAASCLTCVPKLRSRIMRIPFFREHIENYHKRSGLSRRTVVVSLLFLWGMLIFSALRIKTFWIMLILTAVGIAVTIHILYISKSKGNTKKAENSKEV
jgi:uncharacterized membrane protein YbaN (DUF454 family)